MATTQWRNNEHKQRTLKALSEFKEVVLFDTETTGLNPKVDRIIEIAAIRFQITEQHSLQEIERLHMYIRPPFLISDVITGLTGITNESLLSQPYEEDVFEQIKAFFGNTPNVIAAHNTQFDMKMLSALYERNLGGQLVPVYQLDTLEMARDLVKAEEVKNYKLETLATLFGFADDVQFHSAVEDVKVTARLFELFYKEYLETSNEKENNILMKPIIQSINFWEGFRGFSRIYVQTDCGSVYYDIRKKRWGTKDADISTLDMNYIELECLRLTNNFNLEQFAKFKGKLRTA